MSYSNSLQSALPAEILEEDKFVETYPMKVSKVTIVDSNETFRSISYLQNGEQGNQ